MANIFPQNRILSHDIIEGSVLKTGELPEFAFENAPNSIPSELARHNRWFKGDLLLGGFVKNRVKNDSKQVNKLNKPPIYNHIILLNIIGGFAKATLLVSLLKTMFTQSIYFFIPFAIGFFTEYIKAKYQSNKDCTISNHKNIINKYNAKHKHHNAWWKNIFAMSVDVIFSLCATECCPI